jgi:hypothetical protein
MSRISTGDTVVVKPGLNVYTVLTGVATLVVILSLLVVWMRADALFGGLLNTK